jgi:hypothetical protein
MLFVFGAETVRRVVGAGEAAEAENISLALVACLIRTIRHD